MQATENHYCCQCHRTTSFALNGETAQCLACGVVGDVVTKGAVTWIGSAWSNRKREAK